MYSIDASSLRFCSHLFDSQSLMNIVRRNAATVCQSNMHISVWGPAPFKDVPREFSQPHSNEIASPMQHAIPSMRNTNCSADRKGKEYALGTSVYRIPSHDCISTKLNAIFQGIICVVSVYPLHALNIEQHSWDTAENPWQHVIRTSSSIHVLCRSRWPITKLTQRPFSKR